MKIATGDYAGQIILWKSENGEKIKEIGEAHRSRVFCLAFSPDSKKLASGGYDDKAKLWNLEKACEAIGDPLAGHRDSVYSVGFSADGETLVSGGCDSQIIIWSVKDQKKIGNPLTSHSSAVSCVTFTPDGKKVISGSKDKSIIIWDVESQKPVDQVQIHMQDINYLQLLPGGKQIVSASNDTVKIWDFEIFGLQKDLKGHED